MAKPRIDKCSVESAFITNLVLVTRTLAIIGYSYAYKSKYSEIEAGSIY